jgi:uncharacterized membrane protein YfcA
MPIIIWDDIRFFVAMLGLYVSLDLNTSKLKLFVVVLTLILAFYFLFGEYLILEHNNSH